MKTAGFLLLLLPGVLLIYSAVKEIHKIPNIFFAKFLLPSRRKNIICAVVINTFEFIYQQPIAHRMRIIRFIGWGSFMKESLIAGTEMVGRRACAQFIDESMSYTSRDCWGVRWVCAQSSHKGEVESEREKKQSWRKIMEKYTVSKRFKSLKKASNCSSIGSNKK